LLYLIKDANIDEVMAWKNGKFQFGEETDFTTIMKQIARWYDIEIEYKEKITSHIGGSISRDVNISEVLEMLEMTGTLKFQINGKKVIVQPKKQTKLTRTKTASSEVEAEKSSSYIALKVSQDCL